MIRPDDDLRWSPYEQMEAEGERPSEAQAKQKREQELADLRKTFKNPAGFRTLQRILGHAKVFGTVFAESETRMALNEGHRLMGVWLLAELSEALPDDHHKIFVVKE